METGEIIAIVVVVLVLAFGATFLCIRCCKAMLQVVEDEQKPARQSFVSSMRDGLRRSFRSSVRRVSGLRNSFRRSGPRGGPNADKIRRKYETPESKRAVSVATIQDLKKETSEIHPAYLKKSLKNEGVTVESVRGGEGVGDGASVHHTNYPNPLYQKYADRYSLQTHDGERKPGYKGAKPAIADKVRTGRSGYKKMEEEEADISPTHKPSQRAATSGGEREGYNNYTYQEEVPQRVPHLLRYDMPFEGEAEPGHAYLPQGHLARVQGQHSSQGQVAPPGGQSGQPGVDLSRENVRMDNPEKRYMSVDTYI